MSVIDGSLYIDEQMSPLIKSAHQEEGLVYINSSPNNFESTANLVIDTYLTIRRSPRMKEETVKTKWDECEQSIRLKDPSINMHDNTFWINYIYNL